MAVCGLAFLTGLLGMARKLLYTPLTWALAIATFVALFWLPQIVPLLIAAGLGAAFLRRPARADWSALVAFFALLGGLTENWWATRLDSFY
ncbi:hypothetical protein [Corynebacterium phoceense]|uniref:hypothetical protein n=1 Tax=Corynebacterium TaxID=1716 RepID=UPI0030FCE3D4